MVETLNEFGAQLGDFLSMELWQSNNFRLSVKGLLQVFAILLAARFSIWTLNRKRPVLRGNYFDGTHLECGRYHTNGGADRQG